MTIHTSQSKIPIAVFEHYMLADDRPCYPMTCHIRFWFSGRFDRDNFTIALKSILQRHPIFQMTIDGSPEKKTKDIFWQPTAEVTMPFVSWAPQGTPIEEPPNGVSSRLKPTVIELQSNFPSILPLHQYG